MAYSFKHGDRPLEDYTIQRGVGRGGFGEVYYAISDGGREVALKYLRDNPDIELRGVSACMNLKSPHLVTVFDVKKSAEGEYFIIMEYVAGPSLRDLLIAEPNGLGPQKAAYFVREIAKGLGYLHDRGIVHRDLKPGNIFYEDGYVKIGDYGLSKFISVSRHSAQTASIGTVHYMAPEVGSGNYSRGIDIYALGVMLYEMLLGKVPFEGASMGEVLMKHLTEQPEVDQLPHPFGQVIRKALAKDPNDRYQNVDELLEVLFDVDDVRQSVVGFNPTSLSGAARHAGGDLADSPMPSPNPLPAPGAGHDFGAAAADSGPPPEWAAPRRRDVLTDRLGKRLDRVSRKMDKKLRKLGGVRPPVVPPPDVPPPAPRPGPGQTRPAAPISGSDRLQRMVLSGIMAIGMATGVGLLVEQSSRYDGAAVGISSFLLVAAISGGVLLSRWVLTTKLTTDNPAWVQRLVLGGCCLPLMLAASFPALDEGGRAVGALGALLIAVVFTKWDERLRQGASGELRAGPAFCLALAAGILAVVFDAEEFAWMAAGVAAAASLSVQALGWAWPPADMAVAARRSETHHQRPWHRWKQPPLQTPVPPPAAPFRDVAEPPSPAEIPMGIPVNQHLRGVGRASDAPLPPLRSGFARAFWSVAAFLLAGGMIALFVVPLAVDFETSGYAGYDRTTRIPVYVERVTDYDTYMGMICGCIACFSFLIFALRKTTQRKRPGFWQETLRPFFMAVAMTGMGAAITALAMPTFAEFDDEFAGTIVGLVYSSIFFLVLLFLRGKRHRPAYVVGDCRPPEMPLPAVPVGQQAQAAADPCQGEDGVNCQAHC